MKTDPEIEIDFWKQETQKWKDMALRLLLKQDSTHNQHEAKDTNELRTEQ